MTGKIVGPPDGPVVVSQKSAVHAVFVVTMYDTSLGNAVIVDVTRVSSYRDVPDAVA